MALGLHFTVDADASQAKRELDSLNSAVSGLSERMKAAADVKDWKAAAIIAGEINDAVSSRPQAMEMAQQAQGGAGQDTGIGASQAAVKRVEGLDNAILTFNRHLEAARKGALDSAAAQLEKVIDSASSARLKAMEHGRVQEKPSPDSLIQGAESTGEWESAAKALLSQSRYQPANKTIDIDTSHAVSSVKELEGAIAKYQETLREAIWTRGFDFDIEKEDELGKYLEEAGDARRQIAEMSQQMQGSQIISIDASQAIANVEGLDAAILSFQRHLRAAKQNGDTESIGHLEEAIGKTAAARSKVMGQWHIRAAQTPDGAIRRAESTGEWKPAAESLANAGRKRYEAAPHSSLYQQPGLLQSGDINKRVLIDASQARTQIGDLNKLVATLNEELAKATEGRDWKSVSMLTTALDNATSTRGRLVSQANQAQSDIARQNAKNGIFGGQGMWVFQQSLNQITHGILTAWDAALTAAKQRASGDYTGAAVSQKRAKEETIGQTAGMGLGALGFLGGPVLGMITTALGGELGKFIGGIGTKKLEEALAYSAQYKDALSGIDSLNQLYGGAINKKSAEENNRYGMEMRGRAKDAARGTGIETDAFIQALKQSGGYGITSETQAMNMLRTQALWSRFTGTDLSTIQKYAGQAYRYNGETNATATAYGGLMAQNMGKGQMTEFLTAMERIMEGAISRGFIKGSEEIAGNMAMLYKLSGGSRLWQGEQGAQRYSQMSNAISNATNLETTNDVISFAAARGMLGSGADREAAFKRLTGNSPVTVTGDADFRSAASGGNNIMGTVSQGSKVDILGIEGDYARVSNNGRDGYIHKNSLDMQGYNQSSGNVYTGTYADIMQLLERGVSADLLKGQFDAVSQLEGNNTAAIIERFKAMYGLNYTGASQVWAMSRNSANWSDDDWKKAERDIKRFQETPGYQSDSQQLQDILNDLRQKGIQIGQMEFFKAELPALRDAMKDLEKAFRDKQTDNSRVITGEKLEAITNVTRPLLGQTFDYDPTRNLRFEMNLGKINRYENTKGWFGLGGNDYGEEEAERFRGIIGKINDPSSISDSLAYAIEAYAEK